MGCGVRPAGGDPLRRIHGHRADRQRVEIRYMDFWKVVDGKITDNWVMSISPM